MSVRSLESDASEYALRATGRRRLVGILLLLGLAGLVAASLGALRNNQAGRRRHRLALRDPVSLPDRFRQSAYRAAQEQFAFYELAARFEGARLLVTKPTAKRFGWHLERVARVRLEVSPAVLSVQNLTDRPPADFAGRLDGRDVRFWSEPAGEYALVETAEQGPLVWVPRSWVEPSR